jgi:hypothetical protein
MRDPKSLCEQGRLGSEVAVRAGGAGKLSKWPRRGSARSRAAQQRHLGAAGGVERQLRKLRHAQHRGRDARPRRGDCRAPGETSSWGSTSPVRLKGCRNRAEDPASSESRKLRHSAALILMVGSDTSIRERLRAFQGRDLCEANHGAVPRRDHLAFAPRSEERCPVRVAVHRHRRAHARVGLPGREATEDCPRSGAIWSRVE